MIGAMLVVAMFFALSQLMWTFCEEGQEKEAKKPPVPQEEA